MTIAFIFWLLMLLWLLFGCYSNRTQLGPWLARGDLVLFVLLFLLGWKVFGWPIAG